MFNASKKQIFYFDDFLGKTRLNAGSLNHDQRIIEFINLISDQKNSILVLTTREYVLNQAIELLSDFEFSESLLKNAKYIIEMETYSIYEKSLILYNHLYYSKITKSKIGVILYSKKYRAIVEHRNYIPRIIDWVINYNTETSDDNFADLLWKHLENPEKIWKSVIENHISQSARNLISILFMYESAEYETIKSAYKEYNEILFNLGAISDSSNDFDYALKELDGTLINLIISSAQSLIEFNNSSIIDYLNVYFSSNVEYLTRIVRHSNNIKLLWHLASATFEPPHSKIFGSKLNAFSNLVFHLSLCAAIERCSFSNQALDLDVAINNVEMSYVLQKSIVISFNRSLYIRQIRDLADKFISESFIKKRPYIYDYVINISNTVIISKLSQNHSFLIPYATKNLVELIGSAYSISDALKIIKIHSLLQYPISLDEALNSRIKMIIESYSNSILENLEELEIDSMIKLCNGVLEYNTIDKSIALILEELNYIQSSLNEKGEEKEDIDQERDEVNYFESLPKDYINYEDFLDHGEDYFQEFSDLFYDFNVDF